MNSPLKVGVLLNVLLSVASWFELDLLALLLIVPASMGVGGLILVALGQRVVGAWLVLCSSCLFIPIGIVAIIGARKVLDEVALEKFKAGAPARSAMGPKV